MSDQEQDPRYPPGAELEGGSPLEVHTHAPILPPSFGAPPHMQSDLFPSTLSAPTIPIDLNVPWSWGDLVVFLLFYFGCTTIFWVVTMFGASAVMHIGINNLISTRKVLFVSLSIVAQGFASLSSILYLRILAYVCSAATPRQPGEGPWQLLGWRSLGNPPSRGAVVFKYVAGGIGLAFVVSIVSEIYFNLARRF
jgi:hypothetical protein